MSNNIDLDELINKPSSQGGSTDPESSGPEDRSGLSDLDVKLGSTGSTAATYETEEKSAPPSEKNADTDTGTDRSLTEKPEEKKMTKAEMAKMIANNLSIALDEEEDGTYVRTQDISSRTAKKSKSEKASGQTKKSESKKTSDKKRKKKKNKSSAGTILALVFGFLGGFLIIAAIAFYIGGLVVTNGKFLPNTTVNGQDVSMMTAAQVTDMMTDDSAPTEITIIKQDGNNVKIPLSSIDYKLDTDEKVQGLLDKKDTALWFMSLFNVTNYKMEEPEAEFDSDKLKEEINKIDWGDTEPTDAYITSTDEGFAIVPEAPGEKLDTDKLWAYVKDRLEKSETDVKVLDSGAYLTANVTSEDLQDKLDSMNSVADIKITIDFDYTQEVLKGTDFAKWVTFKDDGTYTVDRNKVMGYVEELSKKYDTYNTERKFHATLQGDIVVPTSDDAKYGWWIYQDETADLLVKLIEKGESVTTDPVYYYTTNKDGTKAYVFTGREEARSANDDIGDTYVEIDLTAQTLWYYEKGKLMHTCGIVSGQLKPAARQTLPGVYKVWFKARNYHMKSSNSAGEQWESDCAYWTRVAIVGIGLHDSQWRGNNVGGQIYKTNGSHGCINMTLKDAKYIYDNVEMDTPVVMYY